MLALYAECRCERRLSTSVGFVQTVALNIVVDLWPSQYFCSLCRRGECRPPDCDRCSKPSLVCCDCRVSPESVYIPRASALTKDSKFSIVRMTVASHAHNGTIVTCARPLVTSTSAHVRSESPGDVTRPIFCTRFSSESLFKGPISQVIVLL